MEIIHHGAAGGVTGSCHELIIDDETSLLVDCGLFQGDEPGSGKPEIDFSIKRVRALLVTHCHIDHAGRIPYLLMAGFQGPIYCSEPTAKLLPLVLEDALKIGVTQRTSLIKAFLAQLKIMLVPVPYGEWVHIDQIETANSKSLKIKFSPAGHILGSSYIQVRVRGIHEPETVLFSGDLGAPYTPLLPAPKSPYAADVIVLESTYGDRLHEGRQHRRAVLRKIIEKCFSNRGTVLIPAFSIGRTQELLYELEDIIHRFGQSTLAPQIEWEDIDIIVDSPLAARFTAVYRQLKHCWDREALRKTGNGRHPLSFEQLLTIDSHAEHLKTVSYLKRSGRPAIVIAAGGMCSGGRIVNYLTELIEDSRTDILFVGCQARGTIGRTIQTYGPRNGYVMIGNEKLTIHAGVYTISGYSAHADQNNLVNFVKRMRRKPREIRLVHGDLTAKRALGKHLRRNFPKMKILVEV
ncbi:MAG: MBL fold metallo-hydrolase [bacterium]|nr:MBL fold metallo-hydrolase [bacterium]